MRKYGPVYPGPDPGPALEAGGRILGPEACPRGRRPDPGPGGPEAWACPRGRRPDPGPGGPEAWACPEARRPDPGPGGPEAGSWARRPGGRILGLPSRPEAFFPGLYPALDINTDNSKGLEAWARNPAQKKGRILGPEARQPLDNARKTDIMNNES